MTSASVTSKGQVTISEEIRDYLKLDAGCKDDFVIDENGGVRIPPLKEKRNICLSAEVKSAV